MWNVDTLRRDCRPNRSDETPEGLSAGSHGFNTINRNTGDELLLDQESLKIVLRLSGLGRRKSDCLVQTRQKVRDGGGSSLGMCGVEKGIFKSHVVECNWAAARSPIDWEWLGGGLVDRALNGDWLWVLVVPPLPGRFPRSGSR